MCWPPSWCGVFGPAVPCPSSPARRAQPPRVLPAVPRWRLSCLLLSLLAPSGAERRGLHSMDLRWARTARRQNFGRRTAKVPDQTSARQQPQEVIGHVDLPPAKPLIGRAWVMVVVVVPALPRRDQRQQPVVT